MYYSYVEIEYVATSFSTARTDLALKLLNKIFLGVDPGGSHGMTDSCDTVTHPNPAALLPGWISGWFWR